MRQLKFPLLIQLADCSFFFPLTLHMIRIDVWKIWYTCSSSLSAYLYHLYIPFLYLPICIICLFVCITRWRFKSLYIMQWTIFFSVSTFERSLHLPVFYHILLLCWNLKYCTGPCDYFTLLCWLHLLIPKNVTISISMWIL
jgi:hypothetical protein